MRRHERFEVTGRARVDLHVPAGAVEVHVGDPGAVEVSIDAADADAFEVERVGDAISVRLASRWRARGRNVRVSAVVPVGTDVEITSGSADLQLRGDLGVARLRTASGDLEVERVARLDASTASGDVRVGVVGGDVATSTASGDCTFDTVEGRCTMSSASGDLRVGLVAGDVEIGTASGDVRVGCCTGSAIAVKTVSGDVTLGLPGGIRVEADINTLSGKVRLPEPATTDPDAPRRPVRVRLRAVSGDIRVERVD